MALLLAALACNYPGVNTPDPNHPPADALRQTLDALVTAQFAVLTGTPAPGLPPAASTAAPPGEPPPAATAPAAVPNAPAEGVLAVENGVVRYAVRSGDTLPAIAARFGVAAAAIRSEQSIDPAALLPPGQILSILDAAGETPYPGLLLPDVEVIYSPSGIDFDIGAYIQQAGGYLSRYQEVIQGETVTGEQIIRRVAIESSINPRLLLALLEQRAGWVLGEPRPGTSTTYPIGFKIEEWHDLYRELVMAATHLNAGYFGWREGSLTELKFGDGRRARIFPGANAGTVALQQLFTRLELQAAWQKSLYGSNSLPAVYASMFGDPWARAAVVGPLFPGGLEPPALELPFAPGERWSLTGGPHPSWKTGSPRGAIDFAPVTGEKACAVSRAWALAAAPGLVIRADRNVVAIDLDGDGYEQTGWVLIYLHLAGQDMIPAGTLVAVNQPLGHPSCEGGLVTGTHVHLARKFNGEWIAAGGPLPFVLSGWQVFADAKNYQGGLRKGDLEVVASPVGPRTSIIVR